MPQIQEYNVSTEASGPQGGTSPNLDAVTAYGRGIADLGKDVSDAGGIIQRRQEQTEQAQAFEDSADARLNFHEQLQQQINDGSLDIDKFKGKYEDWVSEQQDNYSTKAGRNAFNRQAARLQGTLLNTAVRGKLQIDGQNAVASWQSGMNDSTNAVEKDPTQFGEVHDSIIEDLHQKSELGVFTPEQQRVFEAHAGLELSKAAIRGFAQQDADNITMAVKETNGKVDPAQFDKATQMLDSDAFDKYMSSDDKKKARAEIRQAQTAGEVEGNRVLTAQKNAQKLQTEAWEQSNIPKWTSGALSVKDVQKSPMDAESKIKWIHLIQTSAKEENADDPKVVNDLINRMHLPDSDPKKISEPGQMFPYVGKGMSPTRYGQLSTLIDKSPEGQALQSNRKMVMDMAKARLVKNGGLMGMSDPDGEYSLMQFTNTLQTAEQDARKNGTPIKDLYDVNSKSFIGNKIGQFAKTPEQIMKEQADRATGAVNIPKTIQTQPSATPNVSSPPASAGGEIRRRTKKGQTAVYDYNQNFLRYEK